MKKILVVSSVLAAILLAAILVLRPGKASADHEHEHEVLCHKSEHGRCEQDYKDRCDDDWHFGGCPTFTPTPMPTATPTLTPTATPTAEVTATPSATMTPLPEPTSPTCSDGEHLDAGGKNCVHFSDPGVESPTGGSPAVTQGQVLGVSTMAGTGVAEETLFNAIFALGSALTAFGVRKIRTSRVK